MAILFSIQSSLLVGILHPTRIYQIPRFVAMETKGVIIDVTPLEILNIIRHLKRSVGGLLFIVWVRVSLELNRLRINNILSMNVTSIWGKDFPPKILVRSVRCS